MENYIMIYGQRIDLTEDQVRHIADTCGNKKVLLGTVPKGVTVKIAGREYVILDQKGEETYLIAKGIVERMEFGDNNNFDGSDVDVWCECFASDLADAIGQENIVEHTLDLTSDDGLKCYGSVKRKVSLLTADLYRKYVNVLDTCKPDFYWFLATPKTTKRHGSDQLVLCVSPSGSIDGGGCNRDFHGVRPFCILKSSIFVSM